MRSTYSDVDDDDHVPLDETELGEGEDDLLIARAHPDAPFLKRRKTWILFAFFTILFGLLTLAIVMFATATRPRRPLYRGYGVASSNTYATEAGMDVLKDGGNVVDAMVTMQMILTLTEPQASGIGGGALITYQTPEGEIIAIDGREESPSAQEGRPPLTIGGRSVAVPGTVSAMHLALTKYGTHTWSECFDKAILLAETGWKLGDYEYLKIKENAEKLSKFPASVALYLDPDTLEPLPVGTNMTNLDLAKTFRILAEEGPESFYNGSIATMILNAVTGDTVNPGIMTTKDLLTYQAVLREPLEFTYRDNDLVGLPMPTSGTATVGLTLHIYEQIQAHLSSVRGESDGGANPVDAEDQYDSVETLKNMFNAMSLAFADRGKYMADADWFDVPLEGLLNVGYAAERSKLLNDTGLLSHVAPGTPQGAIDCGKTVESEGGTDTTHFSLIDRYGGVLSITTTIESTFGSGLVVPGGGFLLNNEMGDFSLTCPNDVVGGVKTRRTALSPFNVTMGGKRPRSSMAPLIVHSPSSTFAVGSPGGSKIIGSVLNVLVNILYFGASLEEAISSPRYITQNDGVWYLETSLFENEELVAALTEMGATEIRPMDQYGSGAVAIVSRDVKNGFVTAEADPRRDGHALTHNEKIN